MDVRILGPLEVAVDGRRIDVGGPQAQRLVAVLVLAEGAVVSMDALIDELWGEAPPTSARHQVHKLIGALRGRLPAVIRTDGPGYRIGTGRHGPAGVDGDAPGITLDAATFRALVADPTVPGLTAALALWRGPALDGIDGRSVRAAAAAWDERRVSAVETLMELRLAAGEVRDVLTDLPRHVAEHPLRESLHGLLMTALYRSGRRADALAAFATARATLADELGLDPGPALSRLHEQILRADPALDADVPAPRPGPERAARPPQPPPAAPCSLPYDLPDFVGRDAHLDLLTADDGVVAIHPIEGMAGVGKTALAVHLAHASADRFPDGQLFLALHAHTPGRRPLTVEDALDQLLRMMGVPAETIPDGVDSRQARWRAELAGRRVLVVLDDAASAAQVRPLLPGSAGCAVLITSRRRLSGIDGASAVPLDVLPASEAMALFDSIAGGGRAAAEPAAAADLVRSCGQLPLAIRIAASRLADRPLWSVRSMAERLRAQGGSLGQLSAGDRGVAGAFTMSYRLLDPEQQRMFRLLGLHPGADVDAHSAAALADVSVAEAEARLEALLDVHLLTQQTADRYTFHDLIRRYAHELAQAEDDRPRRALHDYFLVAATAACDRISREARRFDPVVEHPPAELPAMPDLDAAVTWLTTERSTLLTVIAESRDWQLACVLRAYFENGGHFADWRVTHETALMSAPPERGRALIQFNLGALAMWTDRPADGLEHFREALAHNADDDHLRAAILTSQGMLAHQLFHDEEAAGYLREALSIEHDSPRITALGWNNLGLVEGRLGLRERALEHHRRALDLARQIDSPAAERGILLGLGETSLRLGVDAEQPFRLALQLARAARFRMQEALALDGLAHATRDPQHWRQALEIFTELAAPQGELVREHLARPGTDCCDLCRPVPGPTGA